MNINDEYFTNGMVFCDLGYIVEGFDPNCTDEAIAIAELGNYPILEIADSAFRYNLLGISSITMPNSVTRINERAFLKCGFSNIILSKNIQTIGSSAFEC